MKYFVIICAVISALLSCNGGQSADSKKMQTENDSLKLLLAKNEVEMNDMLDILNSVEEDISIIREAEDFINVQKDTELTNSKRVEIKRNMDLIVETLKKNKKQLADLQDKVNAGNVRSTALQNTIDRLTKDIGEKSEMIVRMQNELAQKDEEIKTLTDQVEELHDGIRILENENVTQSERISQQDKDLHTVYYCFGTKKELKEQNILSGGGLFSKSKVLIDDRFNKEYFIEIDRRRVTEIPLFAGKAEIKTNHPDDTYTFVKDDEGNLTLEIKDPEKFWSLGKYLVIVVG
jgi:hypothetical protein